MARKLVALTFADQVRQQLLYLRHPDYEYSAIHLYVAGVADPWEFGPEDEFDFNEETGVLVVRDGPTDEDGHDNADVPEYVFRLESIVASQLV